MSLLLRAARAGVSERELLVPASLLRGPVLVGVDRVHERPRRGVDRDRPDRLFLDPGIGERAQQFADRDGIHHLERPAHRLALIGARLPAELPKGLELVRLQSVDRAVPPLAATVDRPPHGPHRPPAPAPTPPPPRPRPPPP